MMVASKQIRVEEALEARSSYLGTTDHVRARIERGLVKVEPHYTAVLSMSCVGARVYTHSDLCAILVTHS